MPRDAVDELLRHARSLRELAHSLRAACQIKLETLRDLRTHAEAADTISELASAVAHTEYRWWIATERRESGFGDLSANEALDDALLSAKAFGSPAAHYGLLCGLCLGPLGRYFDVTRDVVTVRDGDLIPVPRRPNHRAFDSTTVSPDTALFGHLLGQTGFDVYEASTELPMTVRFDYSQRDALDEVTWLGGDDAGELPVFATMHPYATGDALEIAELPTPEQPSFFGVRPRQQPTDAVLDALRNLAQDDDAAIVVLPELSLRDPDELEQLIRDDPSSYPPLIVLGSAHVERLEAEPGNSVRANETRVLLRGSRLLTYHKIHPFRIRIDRRAPYVAERLTPATVLPIACGTYTRLAVVICSDLNDSVLPIVLARLMVNLCLVPSLTEDRGNFVPALQTLAGGVGQGVGVICNGTLPAVENAAPESALVWVGLPTGAPDAVTEHHQSTGSRSGISTIRIGRLAPEVTWRAFGE